MQQWFLPDPNGIKGAYIYQGQTIPWDFSWSDPTFAPAIIAVAMPTSLVTDGDGDVTTVSNGFHNDEQGLNHYTTSLSSVNGAGYRLLISRLF
jgi:hypothetical protein